MAKCTKYTDENNNIFTVNTQMYDVGLYIAVYKNGNILEQYGLNIDEDEFHNLLRNDIKEQNFKIINN